MESVHQKRASLLAAKRGSAVLGRWIYSYMANISIAFNADFPLRLLVTFFFYKEWISFLFSFFYLMSFWSLWSNECLVTKSCP